MVGRWHRGLWLYALLAAPGVGAAGCTASSAGPAAQAVAGRVRVDGDPLKTGTIIFFPYDNGKTIRTVSGSAIIENGRFTVPRSKGLVPARYRIAVFEGKDENVQADPKSGDLVAAVQAKDKLPARFNLETELEVEIKQRSIKELRIDVDSK
jgi:hypothetical protein